MKNSAGQAISEAFNEKARKISGVIRYIKFLFIYGGALAAAWAGAFPSGPAWPLGQAQTIVLVGSALVCIGGFILTYTDDNAETLVQAQRALIEAQDASEAFEEAREFAVEYEEASIRLRSLYFAYSASRGVLERAAALKLDDEIRIIQSCLLAMKRDLRVSLGFDLTHTWTICVYRKQSGNDGSGAYLHCIAHDRTFDCALEKARVWREGVGVGGMALAKNAEVVAPDALAPEAGSLFSLQEPVVSALDRDRYRSMIGVPIQVGEDKSPWGVVVVTIDQPEHFGNGDSKGVPPEEGARALAGVVALAVALSRNSTLSGDSA